MRRAFTLIELLVVIAIIAILAAILFPVFARAKEAGKKSVCLSNLRQIATATQLYMGDFDSRLPDRRDLKVAFPGGWRPWTVWPTSDPRTGWAKSLFASYGVASDSWACPSVKGSTMQSQVQVAQEGANLWMWRFDRIDDPVPLDDLWGKTEDQSVSDLQAANNPNAGYPLGAADVELVVDPYFPTNIPTVPTSLRGLSTHFGGRNRAFLDTHARYIRDPRLRS